MTNPLPLLGAEEPKPLVGIARLAAEGEFIQPGHGRPGSGNGAAAWRWRSLPEPALASLPPRGRAWEITRYRAYQAQLAGHTIGETFGRAAAFLKLASANPTTALPVGPRPDDCAPVSNTSAGQRWNEPVADARVDHYGSEGRG